MVKIQHKTIKQHQDEIIDAFATLSDDRETMLDYLIDLGETLAPMDLVYKVDNYLVQGCMSKVWLVDTEMNGLLFFQADSNTAITKGLISLLIKVLSGQPVQAIAEVQLYFIEVIDLHGLVGFQRASGLANMVKEMKLRALSRVSKVK
ncbi:SufE family protein [Cardinium endosymbiont of Culicoides punctatus]|uniref:SufE family protein n=1 Tax=Cardinium endosymbiont of Culicoides punctatus TaxID=2304601 RepID=UPI001058BB7D|nr:SufE family protein [Cardinium endosymbiont of Culicoides punctatus]TDG95481.1 Cysteine desulfuration protein SufE [Cardinium endosymbiont of Culicoides punctatus]